MSAPAAVPGSSAGPVATRFGAVEVPPERRYRFPEGVLGFESIREFVLLDHPGGGPLQWLQAVGHPALAFVVADPVLFFPDYRVPIRREDLEAIGLEDPVQGRVLVILLVPDDPTLATANLQGPVVLNAAQRLGRQLVLPEGPYTTKHRLFPQTAA